MKLNCRRILQLLTSPSEVIGYVLKNRKCMIELFAGSSWVSLYLWLPGLISSHRSRSNSNSSSNTQKTVKAAVCHQDLGGKRLTFAIKGGKAAARCLREVVSIPQCGGEWYCARVGFCVCLCTGKCVQLAYCFFFFQRSKWPVGGKAWRKKKWKEGKPSWASVTYLVTPAGYCFCGCLGRPQEVEVGG